MKAYSQDYLTYITNVMRTKKFLYFTLYNLLFILWLILETSEGVKKIYRLAATRYKSSLDIGQVKNVRNQNGQLLRDPQQILDRWREHFRNISNTEFPHPPIQNAEPFPGPAPPITGAEVAEALRKMKRGKAPGSDDVPVEAWKLLGDRGVQMLTALFNRIVSDEEAPPIWTLKTAPGGGRPPKRTLRRSGNIARTKKNHRTPGSSICDFPLYILLNQSGCCGNIWWGSAKILPTSQFK